MLEPYKMIVVNLIVSVILGIGLLIYKYVYPKRNLPPLLLVLLVSFLPIISIFRAGSYESGDLFIHAPRVTIFTQILFNEHSFPRWLPLMNSGYGDPHFMFSYILPYFIGSIFHFSGFSSIDSIKLILILSFMFSGTAMYLWAKEELGKIPALVSAIFYLFAPYHLVDMHFRVSVAETLSFVFLPLSLFLTKKVVENKNLKWILLLSVSQAMFIMSHQAIFAIFFPLSILYGFLVWLRKNNKKAKDIVRLSYSLLLGILLSAFYWMPILLESQFTEQHNVSIQSIKFTNFSELLYSPWRLGMLFQGNQGEQSYMIGYTQLAVVIISLFLLFKTRLNKNIKLFLIFFQIVFLSLVFLMLPISKPIWQILPFFKYFQFSYRLLVVIALCTAILAGIVVKKINKTWFVVILSLITISYTTLNWGNRRTIPSIDDKYLINELRNVPELTQFLMPTAPIWMKGIVYEKPQKPIEVLSGNADFKEIFRSSTKHIYSINVKSPSLLKENTAYFPGWIVKINNENYPFEYTLDKYPGIITFNLDKGVYSAEISFTNTPVRTSSIFLSIISFLAIIIYFIKSSLRYIQCRQI